MVEIITNEENMVEEEILDNSADVARLKEELKNLEPGSEKHSRLVEDICKLEKQDTDRYKVEWEATNTQTKIENEKDRSEAEIRLRNSQVTNEIRRGRKVKPDTILTVVGSIVIFGGCCVFQANGHALPTAMIGLSSKFMQIPKIG